MSFVDEFRSNYGGLSVAEYVEKTIRSSPVEMARIRETVQFIAAGTSSLLDVGAGHGVLLEELRVRRGIVGVGIEVTDQKVEYARGRGVDMRRGHAARLDFPDRSFDAVVCCEVIEHLPWGTYEAALAEIARVARRHIVITVPYREDRAFARCPYCGCATHPSCHLRSFDEARMVGLLPGFTLRHTRLSGWTERSVLSFLRARRPAPWNDYLVCPTCGFRRSPGAREEKPDHLREWARMAARLLPKVSRPNWLMAAYERE